MRARVGIFLVLLVAGLAAWNYLRPIPSVAATGSVAATQAITGTAPVLPWPNRGSGAVGVQSLGFIASSGNEQPIPAASVTKVMTALIVLEDKPLQKGQTGPTITITDADLQAYQADFADKESVIEVRVGEQLTELQALQGMLIPSANNLAETLARWDAGSIDAFVAKMNKRAADLNLTHTKFADVSGADPGSVSTPSDLMLLGVNAMKLDVFAQVVGMGQAQLPVAGIVYNVDSVLGQSGIIGVKTGSGLSTGANFLFAANVAVDGHQITVYGCVMGQLTLASAFASAQSLIGSMQAALHVRREIARNETIATYVTPWGAQSDLISSVDVDLVEWPGMVLRKRLDSRSIVIDKPLPARTPEGNMHMVLGDYNLDVPLVTAASLYPPGRLWRLTRLSL
ncbi:MAG TPA: D-alanyl-D-alanine carboxypeptidase [Candidatus Dormibacteraeota bacterium]|nr:D-alanyl-D-alanine carboxypeptidase [Candidatus Dormibacteraeota bacterium]